MAIRSDDFIASITTDPTPARIRVHSDYKTITIAADPEESVDQDVLFNYFQGAPDWNENRPFQVAWSDPGGGALPSGVPTPTAISFAEGEPDNQKEITKNGSTVIVRKSLGEATENTLSFKIPPRAAGSADGQGNYQIKGTISAEQLD